MVDASTTFLNMILALIAAHKAGGWSTDKSLRVYLDAVAARSLEQDSETLAVSEWATAVEKNFLTVWSAALERSDSAMTSLLASHSRPLHPQ